MRVKCLCVGVGWLYWYGVCVSGWVGSEATVEV